MLQNKRIRAFNGFAQKFGVQALIDRLRINYENGIEYHKLDGSPGDYDILETEEEIHRLLRFGTSTPYENCPTLETEHFLLRLVSENDAKDLLLCYSDPKSQAIFDNENFANNLHCSTVEDMIENIRFWIAEYNDKAYVRFAVLDKKIQKTIGTVEMYSSNDFFGEHNGGILRIDLASSYETEPYLAELLQLASSSFFDLFGAEIFITKGRPAETSRINALTSAGYQPYNGSDREHYWYKAK